MSDKIRLLIVDDHTMVRQGMRLLLEKEADMEVVGDVGTSSEAFEAMRSNEVDLVIMDFSLNGETGDQITSRLKEEFPKVKIIATTSFDEPHIVKAMLKAGASSYLVKGATRKEFLEAIRLTARGQTFLSPSATQALLQDSGSPVQLTARETEILKLIAAQMTTNEIANQLHLSSKTVENHRLNLMQKIGARNVVGLVIYAFRNGYVE